MDIKDYLNFQGLSYFFDKLKTIFASKEEVDIIRNGIGIDGGYLGDSPTTVDTYDGGTI